MSEADKIVDRLIKDVSILEKRTAEQELELAEVIRTLGTAKKILHKARAYVHSPGLQDEIKELIPHINRHLEFLTKKKKDLNS